MAVNTRNNNYEMILISSKTQIINVLNYILGYGLALPQSTTK